MSNTFCSTTVNEAFFAPIRGLAAASKHARPCAELPDHDFIYLGVVRVLESSESGRAFLQEHGLRFPNTPTHTNYFASLNSARRRDLLRDVCQASLPILASVVPDRLRDIPELDRYDCFAMDGHWHGAAVHDPRHQGAKMAVGHFYSLNLRTHTMEHLAAAEGLHEHDMSALKRVKPKGLRQRVPKGRRVMLVYDKAGIDFAYWKRCRQECAIYFVSRVKENMVFEWLNDLTWDTNDSRNHGVTSDRRVMTRDGHVMRLIGYTDPISGEAFEFLTNEPDLPPGILVELYRRRWNVEKVFDQFKNKLGEKRAWASSLVAKEVQGLMLVLTHNLLVAYESKLEQDHEISNQPEDKRRAKRIEQSRQICQKKGQSLSALVLSARRATQRSVKFIRWIRQSLRDRTTEAAAVLRLQSLYAVW